MWQGQTEQSIKQHRADRLRDRVKDRGLSRILQKGWESHYSCVMLSLQGKQEKRQVSERLGTKLCRGSGGRFSLNNAELAGGVPSWDHMPSSQASRTTENPSWQMTPLPPHIATTNYLLLEVSWGQVSFSQLHHLKRRSSGVTFCQFCVSQSSWILGGCCLARWPFIQAEPSVLCVFLGILPSHTDNLTIKWISGLGGLWRGPWGLHWEKN